MRGTWLVGTLESVSVSSTNGLGSADTPLVSETVVAQAERDAEEAAARSGVRVQTIADALLHQEATTVLQQIWEQPGGPPLSPAMLRAFDYTGNYVAAAFDGERIVGAAAGFRTDHGALHSHIAGVLPAQQGRNIGYALKLHQRAWALRREIPLMAWTFDPLIRRNAHFNLIKLGAVVADFLPDFYGEMTDRINAGDHSDRLLVEWDLHSSAHGDAVSATADAVTVLRADRDGRPRLLSGAGTERVLELPADIEAFRRADPVLARDWREAFRVAIAAALSDGHRIVGLDARNAYVTRKKSS